MADSRTFNGFPKPPVGDIARDTTTRPSKLRLHATTSMSNESTVGGNGERKVRGTRASRR
jgi:hypothetical protein